jgi:hypothetical protein
LVAVQAEAWGSDQAQAEGQVEEVEQTCRKVNVKKECIETGYEKKRMRKAKAHEGKVTRCGLDRFKKERAWYGVAATWTMPCQSCHSSPRDNGVHFHYRQLQNFPAGC